MLKLTNLQKNYRDFRLDCTMEVRPGMITGFIGANGAGKSTTVKAVLGLIRPDGGSIELFGRQLDAPTPADKRRMGVALAESGFSGELTVRDVEKILAAFYPAFDSAYYRAKAEALGLPADKRIKEFSTGMKAKLRVLAAISHKADLLVMDEPTAGLDVQARNDILDLLRQYLVENEHCSILLTSHISSDLEGLCDDIYLIHDGKILLHEDTDTILSSYAVLKVDAETYEKLDRSYILSTRKEHFGYVCFTNEKQFYAENYPGIVMENGNLDDLILMMTGGK